LNIDSASHQCGVPTYSIVAVNADGTETWYSPDDNTQTAVTFNSVDVTTTANWPVGSALIKMRVYLDTNPESVTDFDMFSLTVTDDVVCDDGSNVLYFLTTSDVTTPTLDYIVTSSVTQLDISQYVDAANVVDGYSALWGDNELCGGLGITSYFLRYTASGGTSSDIGDITTSPDYVTIDGDITTIGIPTLYPGLW
jgi:hypothetical protein